MKDQFDKLLCASAHKIYEEDSLLFIKEYKAYLGALLLEMGYQGEVTIERKNSEVKISEISGSWSLPFSLLGSGLHN